MTPEYREITEYAERYTCTRVETTATAPHGPCVWCQMRGAVNVMEVTWIPRPDVLSDGSAECCADCAVSRIRWAVDDALDGSRVRIELYGGTAA